MVVNLGKDSDIVQISIEYKTRDGVTRESLLYSGDERVSGKPFSRYLDKTCLEIINIQREEKW